MSRLQNMSRQQQGASLLEVLISVLILGVGLLGVAAMQATALRNNQSALERTQATIQTYSILDAMRANRDQAIASAYDMAKTCALPAVPGSGATLAQRDRYQWFVGMRESMGKDAGTCGTISHNGNIFTVTVEWDDSRATDDGAKGAVASGRNQVTTKARL
ncbi:type IV pilus modification protein PilV [Pseudoxanthomonas wuyuanensis]|uniref:Type IV pilus assembly protein PilV n=1 Tax=Pseudoxanthomonas wuyuanensis TaxID=1073196 RepID=A0A286DCX6_9GAMM|nr:type IV pilus modification protein PilV [Pseudoxanthomonas wuyuanensis]KAF1720766.1 type IV pilus modification protein PilV [Pseudoxanthomonas wuyuanensis]SOD56469.1 type IV pilus assembly protein PilV [Pseudoxanthomonas wuyuanensis]